MTIETNEVSLDEFLVNEGQPESFAGFDTTFAINNDDEALWAVKRLAIAQRRVNEVNRQASIEIDRINRWVAQNTERQKQQVEYFETSLTNYLVRVREDQLDGRKTLDFPDGTVSSRVTADKVAVVDLETFIKWAQDNGHEEWLRVKREADVSTIKKVVDFAGGVVVDPLTGQVVEGLTHVEGGLSVTVKVSE